MKIELINYEGFFKGQIFPKLVPLKYFNKYTSNSVLYRLLKILNIYSNHFLLLSIDQKIIVGCIILRKKFSITKMIQEWFIYGVAINSEYRGKGYGDLLIIKALEWCTVRKIKRVLLHVNKNNVEAINLYKKHSFEILFLSKPNYMTFCHSGSRLTMINVLELN